MEYINFDIQIGQKENDRYPITVSSPAGEAHESFTFPYDDVQLRDKLKDLELALRAGSNLRRTQSPELQAVQDMGITFFNNLLSGELRSRFDMSQKMASEQSKGLRVRLHIDAPELGAILWEYLYDPRQGEYLCLSTYTPVIRYLGLPQPIQSLEITPPLRVLGMICSPSNLARLDVDQEKQRVEEALAPLQQQGLVHLQWVAGRTWRDLQHAVSAAEQAGTGWHVFHFIGHGVYDAFSDEGQLALEREDGKAHILSATELARLLADLRSLRLVVLNSCESALGGNQKLYSSTASILVRRGIATVLAMQHSISDTASIELSRTFYKNLAIGAPVDAALGEARKAMSLHLPDSVEWGTPVLFMRAADGILFKVQKALEDRSTQMQAVGDRPKELAGMTGRIKASKGKGYPFIPYLKNAYSKHKLWTLVTAVILAAMLLLGGIYLLFLKNQPQIWDRFLVRFGITRDWISPVDDMVMLHVPAGPFFMGSPYDDGSVYMFEKPQHKVYLDEYWIDQHLVTNAQYALCVKAGSCTLPFKLSTLKRDSYYDNPSFSDYPVMYVSWYDADKYCKWVGRRLLTEAEWEKAAGGTDGRTYPWGNQNPNCNLANSRDDITKAYCINDSSSVLRYPKGASPYGVMDMAGNLWEWVNDWWQDNYYDVSPLNNPQGPASGIERVVRGGSYISDWHSLRVRERYSSDPTFQQSKYGIRCGTSVGK